MFDNALPIAPWFRYRLGVLSGLEVLQHPWISSVDWENLQVRLTRERLSFPLIAEVGRCSDAVNSKAVQY